MSHLESSGVIQSRPQSLGVGVVGSRSRYESESSGVVGVVRNRLEAKSSGCTNGRLESKNKKKQRNDTPDHKHITPDGSCSLRPTPIPVDSGRLRMTTTLVDSGRLRTFSMIPSDSDSERLRTTPDDSRRFRIRMELVIRILPELESD